MENQLKFDTEAEYEVAMEEIERLMDKGEANLSESELNKILEMALAAQAYEKEHYYIEPPRTQEGKNELRAYERNLLEKTPASLS